MTEATNASTHTIAGTVLTMPVRVRTAHQHTAMFVVDADAAQAMIDYSGLQVCRFARNRAMQSAQLSSDEQKARVRRGQLLRRTRYSHWPLTIS